MRKGITLVEMLLVVAIMGLLVGIMLPAVQKVRQSALMLKSQNNQRQIVLALHNYASDYQGDLPACVEFQPPKYTEPFVAILPYLEQASYFQMFQNARQPSLNPVGQWFSPLAIFQNPLDRSLGTPIPLLQDLGGGKQPSISSYALNAQFFAVWPRVDHIPDGASQTIWLAEHYGWNCNGTAFLYSIGLGSSWMMQPPTFAHGGVAQGRPSPEDYFPLTTGDPPQ